MSVEEMNGYIQNFLLVTRHTTDEGWKEKQPKGCDIGSKDEYKEIMKKNDYKNTEITRRVKKKKRVTFLVVTVAINLRQYSNR